ncbi:nucleoside kinase [Arthrobacter sp. NicSoilB11]|uniref:nucleoside kinase n=1 Tax=Arthrobacter sp. NicSoilB11 TaxID=2830999 RepID=UPI001CC574FC|nr:nucleoside kinase [Arthrobacter sp. NicSoilB11]BCW75532.1 nucleoside kinase [Arthrobacter sp. NicSoilB11]
MGRKNYLIEGGSGTGKTAVCDELRRRGYHAINGDRELAYQGDPETGEPLAGITGVSMHHHHLWRVDDVKALTEDRREAVTFFCGGSRNLSKFIELFDAVFVLEVDLETLRRRLDARPKDEWGGRQAERKLIERLHGTREEIPSGAIAIDATAPLQSVVDDILRRTGTGSGS